VVVGLPIGAISKASSLIASNNGHRGAEFLQTVRKLTFIVTRGEAGFQMGTPRLR
jgi:hypothetical protein